MKPFHGGGADYHAGQYCDGDTKTSFHKPFLRFVGRDYAKGHHRISVGTAPALPFPALPSIHKRNVSAGSQSISLGRPALAKPSLSGANPIRRYLSASGPSDRIDPSSQSARQYSRKGRAARWLRRLRGGRGGFAHSRPSHRDGPKECLARRIPADRVLQ